MTQVELIDLTVNKSVDARGTACPGPLLEAKKLLELSVQVILWKFFLLTKEQNVIFQSGRIKRAMNILVQLKNQDFLKSI